MHWNTHLVGGPKRVNHAAVAVGSNIYCFGGYCPEKKKAFKAFTSMDVFVLNTSTFRWAKHPVSDLSYWENDFVPYERYGHTAVVYEDKVYVWGGRNRRACDDVLFCFDTVWHCWTTPPTTGAIPLPRDGHTACLWNKYMIIFGGYEEETDWFTDLVYALDLQKMKWKQLKTSKGPPSLRDFHTAVCLNNRMYVFGGRGRLEHDVYCNVLWYLDLKKKIWVAPTVTGNIPIARRSHSAFLYNNKMYIFGGYNSLEEKHFNDMYEFDPAANHWTAIHPGGEKPCERRRQACVVVGDKLFLFGGTSPSIPHLHEPRKVELIEQCDLYVLDFKPTLKTLGLVSVRKHKFNADELPLSLRTDISNMGTPNKISRPNNWTG